MELTEKAASSELLYADDSILMNKTIRAVKMKEIGAFRKQWFESCRKQKR